MKRGLTPRLMTQSMISTLSLPLAVELAGDKVNYREVVC